MRAALAVLLVVLAHASAAQASVVRHGYLPLADGTKLNYTLTLPAATGKFPVVLQYDPYYAGATSEPEWARDGYAMLGVNFRGTACSEGTFQPLRSDIWGADGAQVVDWAARQDWSSGSVGMIGYSFTGVSQLATAEHAGPALKAIAPGNVFPDLYEDMIYPGGIHNGWIPLWIAVRDYALSTSASAQALSDARCAGNLVSHVLPNVLQTLDTQAHPYLDEFWSRQPLASRGRVRIPVLGCVNWQDATVYSRAFTAFRDRLDPASTWLVGGNGTHADCPTSHARFVRFFDRYLKGERNGWERNPRVLLIHELAGKPGAREKLDDRAGRWQTRFARWSDMAAATMPVTLHLRAGGRLDVAPPREPERADGYVYPTPTANTGADFLGLEHWGQPPVPAGMVSYTTPPLTEDAEFLGDGSANLWVASSARDSDLQLTLTEVRPDGQEMYVQNGWLRLSHRRLSPASTALRPQHTHLRRDAEPLQRGRPVLARVHVLPFNHVFRRGSSIRLSIDAPGGYFQIVPTSATNTIHHSPDTDSQLVLGRVRGGAARAPLPACGTLLNQPCRPNRRSLPSGSLALPSAVLVQLGSPQRLRSARRGRPLRVPVTAGGGGVRNARLTLSDARGRRLGSSRRFAAGERLTRVHVFVRRRLQPGRYVLVLRGRAPDGTRVTARQALRLRARE